MITLDDFIKQSKLLGFISPPFEESVHVDRPERWEKGGYWSEASGDDPNRAGKALVSAGYGDSEGQIGALKSKEDQEPEFDIEKLSKCEKVYWFNCYSSDSKYKKFITPESFCFDFETEILTEDGWKRTNKVNMSDKVATLNPITKELEYESPIQIAEFDYNGKMYHLKTKQVDMLVTPNHLLFASTTGTDNQNTLPGKERFKLVSAEAMYGRTKIFKKDAIWRGSPIEFFSVPPVLHLKHQSNGGMSYITIPPNMDVRYRGIRYRSIPTNVNYLLEFNSTQEIKIPIVTWLKFFGLWLAEGSVTKGSIPIGNDDRGLLEEVQELMSQSNYRPHIYGHERGFQLVICNMQLANYLRQFGHAEDKFIPNEIKKLSPQLLRVFLEYYLKGDGSRRMVRNGMNPRINAWTISKKLSDDLQEIALKVGMAANCYARDRIGRTTTDRFGKNYTVRHIEYAITFTYQTTPLQNTYPCRAPKSNIEEWVDYVGKVWCVRTKNGIVYVRRNGKAYWTGNSHPAKASFGLIERIYKHLEQLELLKPNDVVVDFMAGCYDDKTEILTEDGWKFFRELTYTDSVCTLNQENNGIQYQFPIRIIEKPYRGKMLLISSKQVNLAITPDHNMYVAKRQAQYKRRQWQFMLHSADTIYRRPVLFKKDGVWEGEDIEYFILPSTIYNGNSYQPQQLIQERSLAIEPWLQFFGFWLAEGFTVREHGYTSGVCNNNRILLYEIQQILKDLGFNSTINLPQVDIYSKQLFTYLTQFGHAENKFIPQWIKNLPPNRLKTLLHWYARGDGYTSTDNRRNTNRLICWTSSTKLRDDLQEIALKVGWSANYNLATKKGEQNKMKDGRIITAQHDNWSVSFNTRQNTPINNSIYNEWVAKRRGKNLKTRELWIDYDGMVYCVEVPNHVIYVRREGKPVWCGNSGRIPLLASMKGYSTVSIELESHFTKMIEDNKKQAEKVIGRNLDMTIIKGDARKLSELLEHGGVGVVSPPYYQQGDKPNPDDPTISIKGRGYARNIYSENDNNIGNLPDKPSRVGVVSPPYEQVMERNKPGHPNILNADTEMRKLREGQLTYGNSPAQIGNLKVEPSKIGIVSPPYQDTNMKNEITFKMTQQKGSSLFGRNPEGASFQYGKGNNYSEKNIGNLKDSPAQIGNLKDEPSKVGIVSPPYGDVMADQGHDPEKDKVYLEKGIFKNNYNPDNKDNIGNQTQETYTSAMNLVYSEAFKAGISPLVIITKNPTRDGALRRLDLSTISMLQKSGYQILDYHRAVLFKISKNVTLDGSKEAESYKGRLSFFKRLSLQAGNVAAQFEDIIISVNPNGNFGKVGAVSPPYLESQHVESSGLDPLITSKGTIRGRGFYSQGGSSLVKYSSNPDNIGNLKD